MRSYDLHSSWINSVDHLDTFASLGEASRLACRRALNRATLLLFVYVGDRSRKATSPKRSESGRCVRWRPAESLGTSGYFPVWNRQRNRSVLMPRALATSSLRYCFFSGIPNSFSRLGRNALNGQSGSAVTSMESRNCASAADWL